MSIVAAIMVPHPPLIVPAVGGEARFQVQKTIDAYAKAARWLLEKKPDVLVISSPHVVSYMDYFHISPGKQAYGSFAQFGAPEDKYQVHYDEALVEEICFLSQEHNFPAGTEGERNPQLDHATMVPLHFLREAAGNEFSIPIVRIGLSGLPYARHYQLGKIIAQGGENLGRRIGYIASGDLSHYLKKIGPYGFRPEGPKYDQQIMDVMGRAAFGELLQMEAPFCDRAGECGQRSFVILAGALDGYQVEAQALSYEGTTGVGYGICLFTPGEKDDSRLFLQEIQEESSPSLTQESLPVQLARQSFETYVKTGHRMPLPQDLPEELLNRRAGVFVSLHENGDLRGCIGTIHPTTNSVAEEILQNAVSAAAEDPRFAPVREEELPLIHCSVDILGEPEDIDSMDQLDVKNYGVIVSRGRRRGLLLPNLEGIDTVEEQVSIARRKAGIREDESFSLQRFEVVRYQ